MVTNGNDKTVGGSESFRGLESIEKRPVIRIVGARRSQFSDWSSSCLIPREFKEFTEMFPTCVILDRINFFRELSVKGGITQNSREKSIHTSSDNHNRGWNLMRMRGNFLN
jgi:hypothetical protein